MPMVKRVPASPFSNLKFPADVPLDVKIAGVAVKYTLRIESAEHGDANVIAEDEECGSVEFIADGCNVTQFFNDECWNLILACIAFHQETGKEIESILA